MPRHAYTGTIQRAACTMILPKPLMECIRAISKRTGIPANSIAALALDEYIQRGYSDSDIARTYAKHSEENEEGSNTSTKGSN